jgi:hypothetical protein|tara:strand:+ start:97 stop:555 length:459 start_codon:yes stop_codon:yes gene_type:complete
MERDENTVVYIIEVSIEKKIREYYCWLKVGRTADIEQRINGRFAYGWDESAVIEDIQTIRFTSKEAANDYENYLHNKYEEEKLDSEQMKSFHTKNGHTECYDKIMKTVFIDEFFDTHTSYTERLELAKIRVNAKTHLCEDKSWSTKILNIGF